MLIAAFPEVSGIGRRLASSLKVKYTTISTRHFPDAEFHVALKKNPRHEVVVIVNSLAKDPDEKIVETLLVAGIAKDYGAKKVVLAATYLPYMRQDKHFEKYDSFSAKHIMRLFSEFDSVIALDPHLHRIHNLKEVYKKAESISANSLVASYISKNFKDDFLIVGPDEESRQWSAGVASQLGKKVVVLHKERFGDRNVKVHGADLGACKHVLIIDDIISTGKTILQAISLAKEQGAKKIVVIGIHGMLIGDSASAIKKTGAELITTNSIPNKYAKIDVSKAFADTISEYI